MKEVEIWTDGACSGNPGPGGYGVVLKYGSSRRELSGGFRRTTNNRMELTAVIEGLKALKEPCKATVISDSKYIVHAMTEGWPYAWKKRGWRRKDGPAMNPDLWEEILNLCEKHQVVFQWVEGHSGIDENERCDVLATTALTAADLPPDEKYESLEKSGCAPAKSK